MLMCIVHSKDIDGGSVFAEPFQGVSPKFVLFVYLVVCLFVL